MVAVNHDTSIAVLERTYAGTSATTAMRWRGPGCSIWPRPWRAMWFRFTAGRNLEIAAARVAPEHLVRHRIAAATPAERERRRLEH